MTTVVCFEHLPVGSEAAFVHTVFNEDENAGIKEIYTNPGGHGACAWVVFDTEEGAEDAAIKYDGNPVGPANQRVHTSLYSLFAVPASATNTLTKFLRDRDDQLESRTVKITNLPVNQTFRSLKSLFEATIEAFDCYEPDEDDPYHGSYEPNEILHLKSPKPGIGLVQLAKPSMALKVVREFAGTYWKNATLNLRCVPDSEMQNLLVDPKGTDGKIVQLFVTGIRPGSKSNDIGSIFKEYELHDINVPPGGKAFCFIFAREDDAEAILAKYGQGLKVQGRTIRASLAEKSKKKGKRSTGTVSDSPALSTVTVSSMTASPTLSTVTAWSVDSSPALSAVTVPSIGSTIAPRSPTTNLKINNLPHGVGDGTVRTLFEGFDVSKIVNRKGFAFVSVASNEAERAIQLLNGKRIGDMNVSVKVAERRRY